MISEFVQEQKRYSTVELRDKFGCTDQSIVLLIKKLKEYGILKSVRASDAQKDMSELADYDVEISDVEQNDTPLFHVFTFVGVVATANRVFKCFPKYITDTSTITEDLKQVIKVLERYNATDQIVRMYNPGETSGSFNLLAIILYLLNDYYENGSYSSSQDIIETNGSGEILWDRTINDTFTLLFNNRPYYPELLTHKRITDDRDYIRRLHECVLSKCSKELYDADLLDLFDIMPVDISDEEIEDFGDKDYIIYRLQNALSTQFNTRKQLLLKTLCAYILHEGSIAAADGLSVFGTTSFNLVWEKVCAEVMNNQLNTALGSLHLERPLCTQFDPYATLLSIIERPIWHGYRDDGQDYSIAATETLIPDIVTLTDPPNQAFIIFDAKYYCMRLQPGKPVRNQPGIGDVTKQYLYQLAYHEFLEKQGITAIRNCFLMPTDANEIIRKGFVSMDMLDRIGLESIQIRLMPAKRVYELYLKRQHLDAGLLAL